MPVPPRKTALVIGLAVPLLLAGAAPVSAKPKPSQPASPEAAARWIEASLGSIASHRTNPPRAARALALVSVAMDEAASVRRDRDEAVGSAAATVLAYLYPDEADRYEALAGDERGRRIGARVVRRGQRDGSDAVFTGSPPVGLGFWVPTPPAFAPALEPVAGTWRPWNLRSGSRFRPPPPLRPGSRRYAAEMREVYAVLQSLTAEQRRIADFWADGPGTVTPPGHWNQIALDLVRRARLSTAQAARVFAVLNTAQADAFIACWDAKFTYWSERPVTAIRRELDPGWLPYIATPPFPSYVSGHSSTSGAAAEVLARYFPAAAARLRAAAAEAALSRLYGGIHFRTDNDAGLKLGRSVGRTALRAYGASRPDR
jgi:PAP2 superfamily